MCFVGYQIIPTKPKLEFLRLSQVSPVFQCSFDTLTDLTYKYQVNLMLAEELVFNTTFLASDANVGTTMNIEITLTDIQNLDLRTGVCIHCHNRTIFVIAYCKPLINFIVFKLSQSYLIVYANISTPLARV